MELKNALYSLHLLCGLFALSQQSVDLNLAQLQFVSDHLTVNECRKLMTALHQVKFQLKEKDLKPNSDEEPCLAQLAHWNKALGQESGVEELCVRLHQIGRIDVAKELAQTVYGETARQIHKYFLDDPFKETAKTKGSMLMEDDEDEDEPKRSLVPVDKARQADAQLNSSFHSSIVTLTLALTLLAFLACCLYCRATCYASCPWCVLDTWQAVQESAGETLQTLKTLTVTEGLGLKKEHVRVHTHPPETPAAREERERLMSSIMAV